MPLIDIGSSPKSRTARSRCAAASIASRPTGRLTRTQAPKNSTPSFSQPASAPICAGWFRNIAGVFDNHGMPLSREWGPMCRVFTSAARSRCRPGVARNRHRGAADRERPRKLMRGARRLIITLPDKLHPARVTMGSTHPRKLTATSSCANLGAIKQLRMSNMLTCLRASR